jgi:rhamnogalacturonan acetylesterase
MLLKKNSLICLLWILLSGLSLAQTAPATPSRRSLPTLFLIGDSTVRNGNGTGANGLWGWGDLLPEYFDLSKINIVNRARGGRSSRTFLTEGLWDDTLALIKPGDYVIMQFGHNDASPLDDAARARGTLPGTGDETRDIWNPITKKQETVHTYGWYMRKFIKDTLAKGATPIICAPIPRNNWKDGKVVRNEDSYGGWARQLAGEFQIGFINLNEIIAEKYETMGEARVAPLFPSDHTHTSREGAEINAEAVVAGLKALPGNPFKKYF